MTVSSLVYKISYAGNGTSTAFAVPFYFLASSQLLVTLRSAAGVETIQLLDVNYTVTGAGVLTGGTVTMTVAPATGATVTISRNVPITQTTDFQPNDRLPAETLTGGERRARSGEWIQDQFAGVGEVADERLHQA